ncbi:VENN motif pre-toxin domain-containing protein, partial [Serratia microhaemolytica]|uniref:VENN motif pre-toxin domain-containing protein n=1 Tax=Serratia microhaemolytica TaxID=2675110 RepID=UPI001981CD1E
AELMANAIMNSLYPGKKVSELTEEEKQNIASLSTLAAGLAGGLLGDSSSDTAKSAQIGKNAVENNRLRTENEQKIVNNLTSAGQDLNKLEAASCALTKCYAQYPFGSAEYEKNWALAQEGENYQEEQQLLKNYELLTSELSDPLYWNKVPEEVKAKYQGFEYTQADQITDGQQSYDAWKKSYIADKLGISPGLVELTSTGFTVSMVAVATSQAGKVIAEIEKPTVNQSSKVIQNQGGNLPVIREGKVTYEPLAKPDANETRAGQRFADQGYDVTYRATASDQGISGTRTSDLYVDGIGRVDVYTPKTTKAKSIITTIEKKDSQTSAVLVQVDLTGAEMSSIAARVWGKPNVKNVNTLFFQDATGQIHRFDRPIGGN